MVIAETGGVIVAAVTMTEAITVAVTMVEVITEESK